MGDRGAAPATPRLRRAFSALAVRFFLSRSWRNTCHLRAGFPFPFFNMRVNLLHILKPRGLVSRHLRTSVDPRREGASLRHSSEEDPSPRDPRAASTKRACVARFYKETCASVGRPVLPRAAKTLRGNKVDPQSKRRSSQKGPSNRRSSNRRVSKKPPMLGALEARL